MKKQLAEDKKQKKGSKVVKPEGTAISRDGQTIVYPKEMAFHGKDKEQTLNTEE